MSFTQKVSKIASLILLLGGVGSLIGGVALLLQGLLVGVLLFVIGAFMLVLLIRLAHYLAQQQIAQQAAQQSAQMGQPQQGQIVVVAYPPQQQETSGPVLFCPNCGTRVKESSKYCPKCGEELRKATRMYGR